MSILWDSVLAGATAHELHLALKGSRLRAFHLDRNSRHLVLWARDWSLAVRLHPDRGDVLLLPPEEPFPGARPLAARVEGVRSLPDERILLIDLRRPRGPGSRTVVIEWIPTRWNALVVEGRVGAAGGVVIRHVLHPRTGARPLAPGLPYVPPASSGRRGAEGATPEASDWPVVPAGEEGGRALLRTLAWTSPMNLPLLVDLPPEEALANWQQLRALGRGEAPADPVVAEVRGSLTPYPLPLPGSSAVDGTLLDAFRAAAGQDGGAGGEAVTRADPALLARLETEIRGADGQLRGFRRELDRVEDPDGIRARGDLLLARFHLVSRGAERVVLEDFEGGSVEIELDPSLPVQENAARLYSEAARVERTRAVLPARIEKASARLAALEALREQVLRGDADLEEAVGALLPPAATPPPGSSPHDAGPSLPYRRFRSSGGLEIRVGRGARWNDDLTFRHSSPQDVWLHARESAGAHVILRWPGPGNPPARDLEEAAILAALHSRARSAGSAPVDWTYRKYVRKPRKSAPGRVLADRVRTLFVEPDPSVRERLELDRD